MSVSAKSPGCEMGDHERHVEHWLEAPEGVLGGAHCPCPGECIPPDMSWMNPGFKAISEGLTSDEGG